MSKLKFLVAFALGYVAGAAAGRQRYESIKVSAQRMVADPRVQSAAQRAGDTLADRAPLVAAAIKDRATATANMVKEKVTSDEDVEVQPPAPTTGPPPIS